MLPPVFTITPEMLRLIAELEDFKGQWRMIRSLSPNKLSALRKVATIESVGSSTRIEGSRLTNRQVEDLLDRQHITEFKTRDEQEVAGYAYVMDQVFDAFEQIPVTENMIGQLHQDLLRHSTKDERHRGHYKTLPNHVAAFDADGKEIGIEDTHATDLHPLAKKILPHFADYETLTLSQLVKLTNGKPSTLKLRLKELIQHGHLLPKGQGRGAHYVRKHPF